MDVRSFNSKQVKQTLTLLPTDCKTLAPVYEQLADSFVSQKDKVTIAKVDADSTSFAPLLPLCPCILTQEP